jgi:hypothetical protein
MADESPEKRTAGSQRALGLAELVNKVFANERIPSTLAAHAGYRVEMSGPETLSTAAPGGASHQLMLVPADASPAKPGDGGAATIVIGMADANLTQLELRVYEDLEKRHAERFNGDPLPIDSASYDGLRKKIEQIMERQGIETISTASRNEPTLRPAEMPAPKPVWAFVLVGIVLAAAAIFFALRR